MPSERPAQRLADIIQNAEPILRYTDGMSQQTFESDFKTLDAVERCFERIAEAAAKLGDLAPTLMPNQPWPAIRALGNQLRHAYDVILPDRLWDVVMNELPSLRAACRDALGKLSGEGKAVT